MNMVTEIELEEVQMTGGQKIKGSVYPTISKTLYTSYLTLSEMLFWLYECSSNKMLRGLKAMDSTTIWKAWDVHKTIMDLEYEHNNIAGPTTVIEYKVVLPESRMLRKYRNKKLQNVAMEIFNYMHVGMTRDEAAGPKFFGLQDMEELVKVRDVTEKFIRLYVGTGLPIEGKKGVYDVGIDMPSFVELGDLSPTNDLDAIKFYEPSANRSDTYIKDAKDTEIPIIKDEIKPSTNV